MIISFSLNSSFVADLLQLIFILFLLFLNMWHIKLNRDKKKVIDEHQKLINDWNMWASEHQEKVNNKWSETFEN